MTVLSRKLWLLLWFLPSVALAGDSLFIRVHFLYGSKPAEEYSDTEHKWFGGKWGGHVGIEIDSNRVIDFMPAGSFHWVADKENPQSHFVIRSLESFWETFGSPAENVKKMSIRVPVTAEQKKNLDYLAMIYESETPYDYAFFGMRCASAAYDLLAEAGILKKRSRSGTIVRYFYPKPLRKKMIRLARRNHWEIIRETGTNTRKWEQDPPRKR